MSTIIGGATNAASETLQKGLEKFGETLKTEIREGLNQRSPTSSAVELVLDNHPGMGRKEVETIVKKVRQGSIRLVNEIIDTGKKDINNGASVTGSVYTNFSNEEMNRKATYGNFK